MKYRNGTYQYGTKSFRGIGRACGNDRRENWCVVPQAGGRRAKEMVG